MEPSTVSKSDELVLIESRKQARALLGEMAIPLVLTLVIGLMLGMLTISPDDQIGKTVAQAIGPPKGWGVTVGDGAAACGLAVSILVALYVAVIGRSLEDRSAKRIASDSVLFTTFGLLAWIVVVTGFLVVWRSVMQQTGVVPAIVVLVSSSCVGLLLRDVEIRVMSMHARDIRLARSARARRLRSEADRRWNPRSRRRKRISALFPGAACWATTVVLWATVLVLYGRYSLPEAIAAAVIAMSGIQVFSGLVAVRCAVNFLQREFLESCLCGLLIVLAVLAWFIQLLVPVATATTTGGRLWWGFGLSLLSAIVIVLWSIWELRTPRRMLFSGPRLLGGLAWGQFVRDERVTRSALEAVRESDEFAPALFDDASVAGSRAGATGPKPQPSSVFRIDDSPGPVS